MANINLGAPEPTENERLGYPKAAPKDLPMLEQIQRNLVVGGKWEATGRNRCEREPYPGYTRKKYEEGWERMFGAKSSG